MEAKCICGHRMRMIKTKIELRNSNVTVKDVSAYYCSNCNEELFTSEQVECARSRLREMQDVA